MIPWTAAPQASLSITNSRSLLKLMPIKLVIDHPTISSSIVPFSSCLQSFPASGYFPVSQFFASVLQLKILPATTKTWCSQVWCQNINKYFLKKKQWYEEQCWQRKQHRQRPRGRKPQHIRGTKKKSKKLKYCDQGAAQNKRDLQVQQGPTPGGCIMDLFVL